MKMGSTRRVLRPAVDTILLVVVMTVTTVMVVVIVMTMKIYRTKLSGIAH